MQVLSQLDHAAFDFTVTRLVASSVFTSYTLFYGYVEDGGDFPVDVVPNTTPKIKDDSNNFQLVMGIDYQVTDGKFELLSTELPGPFVIYYPDSFTEMTSVDVTLRTLIGPIDSQDPYGDPAGIEYTASAVVSTIAGANEFGLPTYRFVCNHELTTPIDIAIGDTVWGNARFPVNGSEMTTTLQYVGEPT